MERRAWMRMAATFGGLALIGTGDRARSETRQGGVGRLAPPPKGPIQVAFLISEGANVMDTAGPWEVFQDVMVPARGTSHDEQMPFRLFTVAEEAKPVRMTGGLRVMPDHPIRDAPQPQVIVVPAMQGSKRTLQWLKDAGARADVTMSVCTGAFQLAQAGLLDGLAATTHHDFWDDFAAEFPKVRLERGSRFVEGSPRIATAGGLTSGIDMALRVVERYFGHQAAVTTARYMEHEGRMWRE